MRAAHGPGRLRIIGGTWRSRTLDFPAVEGLRPTPGRVRETLFNWLREVIEGARCLDLYAGSGALGLEALSRGAQAATFVDRHPAACARIQAHLHTLKATGAEVIQADSAAFLLRPAQPYDVVFLDPPFGHNLLTPACQALEERGWLAPRAWVYLEAERSAGVPSVPPQWEVIRSCNAGDVGYHLARRTASATP